MVTLVAPVAVTVNVEDCPAVIDAGVAVIVTTGATDVSPGPTEPHPASSRSIEKVIARGERIERKGRQARTFFMVVPS
jgi:hypothetical protein